MSIKIKRAYEDSDPGDGKRFLVDRVWPRGVKKEDLDIEDWLREVAPSKELRQWFAHDPEKWNKFQEYYVRELEENTGGWRPILREVSAGTVTLVYSANDPDHNNAVVLKNFLEKKLQDKQ